MMSRAGGRVVGWQTERLGQVLPALQCSSTCHQTMQAEAAAKAKAKEDLKAFLLSNEINKKARRALGPSGTRELFAMSCPLHVFGGAVRQFGTCPRAAAWSCPSSHSAVLSCAALLRCPPSACFAHCPGPGLPACPAAPQIREEQAEAEQQQDIIYMQQQAAQLDRQERERQQMLEKVKAVQVGPLPAALPYAPVPGQRSCGGREAVANQFVGS